MERSQPAHAEAAAQDPRTRRLQDVRRALLAWYRRGHRDLPWRRTRDPYAIWVSEIMLQQTRVETVVPYYERFLAEFPTVHALAEAPIERVLTRWAGLGYYRRARLLHEGARQLAAREGGALPRTAARLAEVRGIGRYTAGAIASIAMNEEAPIVDGNVARVLARVFGIGGDVTRGKANARVWSIAAELARGEDPGAFNQSLMELGALVCTPRAPRCDSCPARAQCVALREDRVARLPAPRARAAPKPWRRVAVVASGRAGVLLAQRAPGQPFAGLWEPPCADGEGEDAARALAHRLGVDRLERAGDLRHRLTHRALTVGVWIGRSRRRAPASLEGYSAVEWVPEGALAERAIGALGRRLLDRERSLRSRG